jgi:hypothetical protein
MPEDLAAAVEDECRFEPSRSETILRLSLEYRAKFAQLLRQVASEEISAQTALEITKTWTDAPWGEPEFDHAWHFLGHFDADQDIRQRDPEFARIQIETLHRLADRLAR